MDDIYQSAYTGEQIDAAIKRVLEGAQGGDQGGSSNPPAVLINKRITSNGSYSAADDGVDGYSTVSVNVKVSGDVSLPTLKTPSLTLDSYNATLAIDDSVNGTHTEQYLIYYDTNYVGSSTDKTVNMLSMTNFAGDGLLSVVASASQFVDSPEATVTWSRPKLKTPVISIDDLTGTLTIQDSNGSKTSGFKIYVDDEFVTTVYNTTVVLADHILNPSIVQTVSVVAAPNNSYYLDSTPASAKWRLLMHGTEGLEYTLSSDGTYYTLTGIGSATGTEIIVASIYNGLPVKRIGKDPSNPVLPRDLEIDHLYIPEGIERIAEGAFFSRVNKVTLPSSLTSINAASFYISPPLEIHINDIASWCTINMSTGQRMGGVFVYSIQGSTTTLYLNDEILTNVIIPEGVTVVQHHVFRYFKSITSVTFPESLERIGSHAFDTTGIVGPIEIPSNVADIGEHAFGSNGNITSLVIKGPARIGYNVIINAFGLRTIAISRGVTPNTYSYTAFKDVPVTGTVYYGGTEEEYSAIKSKLGLQDVQNVHYNVDIENFVIP